MFHYHFPRYLMAGLVGGNWKEGLGYMNCTLLIWIYNTMFCLCATCHIWTAMYLYYFFLMKYTWSRVLEKKVSVLLYSYSFPCQLLLSRENVSQICFRACIFFVLASDEKVQLGPKSNWNNWKPKCLILDFFRAVWFSFSSIRISRNQIKTEAKKTKYRRKVKKRGSSRPSGGAWPI